MFLKCIRFLTVFAVSPLVDLLNMAPKDLWPNADMFFKQVKERKRKEKLGLKTSIAATVRSSSPESPARSGSPVKGPTAPPSAAGSSANLTSLTAATGAANDVKTSFAPAATPAVVTAVAKPPLSTAPSAASIPFSQIEVDHVSVQSDLNDDEASIATNDQ